MTTTDIRIKFSVKFLPIIALFKADVEIRYYLEGIRIEPAPKGGIYLVASEGHRLAVIYDKAGTMTGSDGVILRISPELIRASKVRSPLSPGFDLNVLATGDRVSIANDFGQEHSDMETFIQPGKPWIMGNYPNWRRLLPNFPKLKPGFSESVNGEFLADYAKIKTKNKTLAFWQAKGSNQIVVQHIGVPEMVSIIMPMRVSEQDTKARAVMFNQFPQKP